MKKVERIAELEAAVASLIREVEELKRERIPAGQMHICGGTVLTTAQGLDSPRTRFGGWMR